MKSRVTRCGCTHELSLIAAAVCLLAVAFSLPGRLHRGPGKAVALFAAILLAIGFPLLGGPLLIYLIFRPRHQAHHS